MTAIATKSIDCMALVAVIAPPAPRAKHAAQLDNIAALGKVLPALMTAAALATDLRLAHFLAQVAHESDGFCVTTEYASGSAYEGRIRALGNTEAGDGPRYRGRGLIQTTGRRNYQRFTEWMHRLDRNTPDFLSDPESVAVWPWAGWTAVWYWQTHRLNDFADRDDLVGATIEINGGRNGLADRRAYLGRAKTAIAAQLASAMKPDADRPTLRRGMDGDAVEDLQRDLRSVGLYTLAIDGDFGAGTDLAVRAFQRAHRLNADGIVAAKTWAALTSHLQEG